MMPDLANALPHDVLKPSDVQGWPRLFVSTMGLRLGAALRADFKGAPTGTVTRFPVLFCRNLMAVPS